MDILQSYMPIYNKTLQDLEKALPFLDVPMPKVGREPKLSDIQIAVFFIKITGR